MISTDRLCMGCMNDNGGEKICPICNFDSSAKNPKTALPIKSLINDRFLIGRVLSVNGEGISYIGWDTINDAIVKVKEYFPNGVAKRNADKTVSILKGKEYTFNEGLLEFLEINKAIKESDLPSLVPVVEVFEENGTAFSVTQNIVGVSLSDFLKANGGTLKWEQARALLLPLIDTIKGMHDRGFVHKGISTETIIVGRDGKLRLSDFSVNKLRYENEELSFEMLDGFAAAEQYYNEEELKIGTHTDVYGFAAMVFNVLIGTLPPKATARLQNDVMSIPAKFAEELPRQVLSSIANALQVRPADRTPDMETFKNQLVYGEVPSAAAKAEKPKEKPKKKNNNGKVVLLTTLVTVIFILLLAVIMVFTVFKEDIFGNKDNDDVSTPSTSAPTVEVPGDRPDDAPEEFEKTYVVPDFAGKYYSSIAENENNDVFVFVVKRWEYSDQPRGTVYSQSVAKDTRVKKETEIELVLSLGPKDFKMPSVINKTENDAKLELLKSGFIYENIEVMEKYDEEAMPNQIIEQYPAAGTQVNGNMAVKIYINTYKGDEADNANAYN